ncbi:MAG TPA: tRNA glutamyl-Q(34) synthetase GluQRS [Desulfuromonadales bacterium]|nr:tRNA glutamyl-Q(34) synthetase GluQRS [Desulfuromonadales bacterium]
MNDNAGHQVTGRFAPSPTGALHLGSLVAAVGSYLMAKRDGGRWLVRLDDLDVPRQLPGMADDILRTLETFGLQWDGDVARQSRNTGEYQRAFEVLRQQGLLYPCCCSRKDLAMASSAPAADDGSIPYVGSCRNGLPENFAVIRSWRLLVGEGEIRFDDLRSGVVCQRLDRLCGDFAVRRGTGEFTYQLAVVVDDYLAGVTQVVRGDDLLDSTPRQIYLQRLLGYPQPEYCHLPLVTGPTGAKLSKRDHLVSHSLGSCAGRERDLLIAVLRFLGLRPPVGLEECPCSDILQWGVTRFDPCMLPAQGGVCSATCVSTETAASQKEAR